MSRIALHSVMVALACLGACEQSAPSPSPAASPGSEPAPATPAAPAPEVGQVEWPPTDKLDQATLRALPQAGQAAVGASAVPVLVPRRPELLAGAVIVAKEHWTSFWGRTPAITVTVMATRMARRYDHIPPTRAPRRVRGAPALITQNEGIWSATWTELGVTYTLDLECASPRDAACASDAELLAIAEDLAYVGGAGAGARAQDEPAPAPATPAPAPAPAPGGAP